MIPRVVSRPLWFAALGAAAWSNRDNLRRWSRSLGQVVERRRHGSAADPVVAPTAPPQAT
jgi:hypothetical protein